MPETFEYAAYLASKASIDDRSLNHYVWRTFVEALHSHELPTVRILEVGGGIGGMFKRLLDIELSHHVEYTLLDVERDNLAYFESHVEDWMKARGFAPAQGRETCWVSATTGQQIRVNAILDDIYHFLEINADRWDVLIAQAFLDLFDLNSFLPALLRLVKSNGWFYFPINFDGITSFLPTIDRDIDEQVSAIYHNSMDARSVNPLSRGRSESGRHLLEVAMESGANILAAGGSDWIVHPFAGGYKDQDGQFLLQILDFVEKELLLDDGISPDEAGAWVAKRKAQVEECSLIYLAHQIDLLGAITTRS